MSDALIHAVMFLLTYTADGAITHAQVIGGYADLDACKTHLPGAAAAITPELKDGEQPEIFCQGLRVEK
jgi:hypothetical protein